uniref:Claudin-4 n=1 Tax=Salmo salar TaxID=8030 RepID=E0R8M5_SALSA|nr:Claudin-4 [Salmo salar]
MASAGFQMLGTALGIIGWIGAIVVCALPQWKVTAFIGENIITAQTTWQGIWMNCVVQSTGQMQCKVYDSMLALPQDLQAARALIIISIMMGLVGILLSVAGGKCTNTIIRDFYNPMLNSSQKMELGAALYIGWGAAALMIIGGGFLCANCPPKEDNYPTKYSAARSTAPRDYV